MNIKIILIIIFTSMIITGCTEKESGYSESSYSVSVVFTDMTFQQYDNITSHIITEGHSIGKTVDLHFTDEHVERLHYVTSIEKIYCDVIEPYNEYMSQYTKDIDHLNSIYEECSSSKSIDNKKALAKEYIEEAENVLPRLEEFENFLNNNEQQLINAGIDTKNVKNILLNNISKIKENIKFFNDFLNTGLFVIV